MKHYRIAFAAMVLALPSSANSADLTPGAAYRGTCAPPVHASVPIQGSLDAGMRDPGRVENLWPKVQQKYLHAVELSQSDAIISNPSQVYTWAEATKLSCGKAIGFLRSNELHALQLYECECLYRRMLSLLR